MTRLSSNKARLAVTGLSIFILSAVAGYFLAHRLQVTSPLLFALGAGGLCGAATVIGWLAKERSLLRTLQALANAARQLAAGDFTMRTGLASEPRAVGELARTLDSMSASLKDRTQERERAEKTLLTRSLQQTVVSALGQFALVSNDFTALLNQAVILVSQTLEVEYCSLEELQADGQNLVLRAGVGWQNGIVGTWQTEISAESQAAFTLAAGEPVVFEALRGETRFLPGPLLLRHGVVSGMTVAVAGQGKAFGVLGAHTTHQRKFTADEMHFLLAVATVLAMAAARKRTEAQLEKLAAFAKLNPNPAMELGADGGLTYFNDAAMQLASAIGRAHPRGLLPPNIDSIVRTCLTSQNRLTLETQLESRHLAWSFNPVAGSQAVHCYVEDITERLSLEAQLRQSQKMESVGQLAAGVAHDFNNMLTIIQGHSGMLLAKAAQKGELLDSAQAIYFAAERAAGLTRQLLMFSRKNVMQPKPLDLREVVTHMGKMLQRLLGETITLEFRPPPELALVHADVGMVEQVIMNLAVNARDAMPKGGTLTISTSPVQINEAYVHTHPEAHVGSFVCLRVTDTGCGMDAYTMARIFEPFFTTKEVGKGTGLGLATVYGIMKQHEGWIDVASELSRGTTFSVFFPATAELAEAKGPDTTSEAKVQGGKETILIVEDEPVLRDMAHVILQECGYNILEASSGREALGVWERNRSQIDLVLTDMVMPEGISGMDLAQRLLGANPRLKIVFASGYSMEDMDTAFVRNGSAVFLQKPYTHITLAKAVRDCLDH